MEFAAASVKAAAPVIALLFVELPWKVAPCIPSVKIIGPSLDALLSNKTVFKPDNVPAFEDESPKRALSTPFKEGDSTPSFVEESKKLKFILLYYLV